MDAFGNRSDRTNSIAGGSIYGSVRTNNHRSMSGVEHNFGGPRPREPFAHSSSGGTNPRYSRSRRSSLSNMDITIPAPSEHSSLVRGVGAMKLIDPAKPSIQNSAFLDMASRKQLEEELRLKALALARQRYIKSLKNRIYKGESGPEAITQLTAGKPKIYNSIESAADKRANHLFLFPDSDPAVYRRQINIPSTFTHEPLFGF